MPKKRRKSSRFRGSQTHKRGHRKRTRGSGNRGGVGMSGTGKRADQKKTFVIKLTGGNNYFGRDKTLRRGTKAKKLEVINLNDINSKLDLLLKKGTAKQGKDSCELNLKGFKILGEGEVPEIKLIIKASAASKSAIDKVKKAGGDIIFE